MIATSMHSQNIAQSGMRRMLRSTRVARIPARLPLAVGAAAGILALSPLAHACGYHDAASTNVGMLNWAYPDSLHVRTAVWMAQTSGVLPRRESPVATDPQSVTFRFEQSVRLRDAQARLGQFHHRVEAELAGQPMPAFAVLLIGPMLWTRFESSAGSVNIVLHATGPIVDDVVLVTDEAVIAALTAGLISALEARAQGLVKPYGSGESVERLFALLDHSFPLKQHPRSQTQPFMEAPQHAYHPVP